MQVTRKGTNWERDSRAANHSSMAKPCSFLGFDGYPSHSLPPLSPKLRVGAWVGAAPDCATLVVLQRGVSRVDLTSLAGSIDWPLRSLSQDRPMTVAADPDLRRLVL